MQDALLGPARFHNSHNVHFSLLDLELAQPMTDPPRLPSHKIRTGDIVGLQEYKKDKPTSQSLLSGVVSKVTDSVVTVALSQRQDDDELPQELQDRCQMCVMVFFLVVKLQLY
jgi:DNA polymerase alpha-associated DNA helicase A